MWWAGESIAKIGMKVWLVIMHVTVQISSRRVKCIRGI